MTRPYRALVTAFALLLTLTGSQCGTGTTAIQPPPNSWLVLLCRASDLAAEPQPREFYEALFRPGAQGVIHDYFNRVSGGKVDLAGSQVYGWFPMPVTAAELGPAVRNNGMPVTRRQTARDCENAALVNLAATTNVDPANFVGILSIINMEVDSGAAGSKSVVISAREASSGPGFVEHEMLHVIWAPRHSRRAGQDMSADHRWKQPGDADYKDCWDMMSFADCDIQFYTTASVLGSHGPELNGSILQQLGWLPADRIKDVTTTTTLDLAPIGDPAQPGFLLANVDIPGQGGAYAVEYREPTRFDAGIPRATVLIREARNRTTYLVYRQNGTHEWLPGEVFTDTLNFISVRVDAFQPGKARVTINTNFTPAPLNDGSICGNKYRGQIAACPAGLQCNSLRGPEKIQTIDYFCQP